MDIYQILITHNRAWTLREIVFFIIIFSAIFIIAAVCVMKKKIRLYQAVAILLMLIFVAVVFASTVFTRDPGQRKYQLEVFWSWKEIFGLSDTAQAGSTRSDGLLQENILNMVLLFPLGLLLPFARARQTSWWRGLIAGLITSVGIEILQLILCRGLFEFDDIIHNTIGCVVGCICGNLFWNIFCKMAKHKNCTRAD